nr:hypothetical protein Iba_chr14cCG5250 [Ipomoea batatas]
MTYQIPPENRLNFHGNPVLPLHNEQSTPAPAGLPRPPAPPPQQHQPRRWWRQPPQWRGYSVVPFPESAANDDLSKSESAAPEPPESLLVCVHIGKISMADSSTRRSKRLRRSSSGGIPGLYSGIEDDGERLG